MTTVDWDARQNSLDDYAAEMRAAQAQANAQGTPAPAIVRRMRVTSEVCIDGVWIRAGSVTALHEAVELIRLVREIAPGLWEPT